MDLTGKTHKQEIDKLQTHHQTSITALNDRITELQQQLQANQFQQFQLPPPFIPQNQTFNTTANDTVIQNLSTSLIMQTNIAKQQFLIQAKAYDGKDPSKPPGDLSTNISRNYKNKGWIGITQNSDSGKDILTAIVQQQQRVNWQL